MSDDLNTLTVPDFIRHLRHSRNSFSGRSPCPTKLEREAANRLEKLEAQKNAACLDRDGKWLRVQELEQETTALCAECDALREAGQFALEHVFDPPKGWYPAKAFPYEDAPIEEQLERRDVGAVYVSQARERLRQALAHTAERKRSDVDG